jgi:pyruvyltransferase
VVEVVHWNPVRPRRPGLLGRLMGSHPVNNFGDLLGPLIVREILERSGLRFDGAGQGRRLLAVGSILHFAQPGDVVWGTGVNGKKVDLERGYAGLDVRAVRGPITADFLRGHGVYVPDVYGDPGLLVGSLWTRDELRGDRPVVPVSVVPNFHDFRASAADPAGRVQVISPQLPVREVLARIAASEYVVGSSLHGVIVAESLGIPARFVRSGVEPDIKYRDYYEGTGRSTFTQAASVEDALAIGPAELPRWDPGPLLAAFPGDLWQE